MIDSVSPSKLPLKMNFYSFFDFHRVAHLCRCRRLRVTHFSDATHTRRWNMWNFWQIIPHPIPNRHRHRRMCNKHSHNHKVFHCVVQLRLSVLIFIMTRISFSFWRFLCHFVLPLNWKLNDSHSLAAPSMMVVLCHFMVELIRALKWRI